MAAPPSQGLDGVRTRYVIGDVELLCVDIAALGGLWLGVGQIVTRITCMLALPAPTASMSSGHVEGQL